MSGLGIGGVIGVLFIIVVVAVLLWAIATYNGFVKLRNLVQESWRQVDVELQRRYDLIPNLVDTVKGYASHERNLFEEVTRARAQAAGSHGGPAERAVQEDAFRGDRAPLRRRGELPRPAGLRGFASLRGTGEHRRPHAAGRRFYNANVRSLNPGGDLPAEYHRGHVPASTRRSTSRSPTRRRARPRVEF